MTQPAQGPTPAEQPILLFDGVCNLCSGVTRFVIRHDPPPGKFRFVTLQSERGQEILRDHGLPGDALDTFVMIEGKRAHVRSTAGLRVLRGGGFADGATWFDASTRFGERPDRRLGMNGLRLARSVPE